MKKASGAILRGMERNMTARGQDIIALNLTASNKKPSPMSSWKDKTCGCATVETPIGALVPPVLIWNNSKRLVAPRECQLFDVVRPTPDHPKHGAMIAMKQACAEHQPQQHEEE